MAENSGSSAILGVIIGALLIVGVLVFVFGGIPSMGGGDAGPDIDVEVPAPSAPAPN
jgi:hypothetical protein